jgi:hypothetical protein
VTEAGAPAEVRSADSGTGLAADAPMKLSVARNVVLKMRRERLIPAPSARVLNGEALAD